MNKPASPAPDALKHATRLPQDLVIDPPLIEGKTGAVLSKYPYGPDMPRLCSKTTLPPSSISFLEGVNMCADAPIRGLVVSFPGPSPFLSPASALKLQVN